MAKNKKKSANIAIQLNDESYIKSGNARKLEILKCLINDDWQESGLAQIFILRVHKNANVTAGIYLVDTLCTGLKDSFYKFNADESYLLGWIEQIGERSGQTFIECDYVLAHNIIYGAIEFADEFNIKPAADFKITQMILEEDTDEVPLLDIDFGKNGKPFLFGNADDPKMQYYLQCLRTHAGEGNFDFIAMTDDDFDEDEFDEDDDFKFGDSATDGDDEDDEDDDEDDDIDVTDAEYKASMEFFDNPQRWTVDNWEVFLEKLPEAVLYFGTVTDYIYEKAIANPALAVNNLMSELETSAIKITYKPITLSYKDSPQELREAMEIFNKMSDQDSHKVLDRLIGRLNKNIVKWPNNPVFYNYVGTIYSMLDVPEMAIEASQKTIDKFPDYLMGKIAHGYNLINNDRTDEVAALFNHEFSLNQVCPDREEFHISEYVAFHTLMSYYFVKKEDIITARTYRNMVEDIDIPENVPVNEEILELVDIEVEECVHTLLVDTGKDKKARAELIALLVN